MEKARTKAITILEFIAEYLKKPKIFDCQRGRINDTRWYDLEDKITNIIKED